MPRDARQACRQLACRQLRAVSSHALWACRVGAPDPLLGCLLGPAGEQLWAFTLAGLDVVAFVMVMRGQFRKKRPHLPRWAIVDDED